MEKGFSLLQITFALLFPWKFRLKNSDNVSRVICPKPVKSLVRRFFSVYWMEMFFLVSVQDTPNALGAFCTAFKIKWNTWLGISRWNSIVQALCAFIRGLDLFFMTEIQCCISSTGFLVLGFWSKEPLELTRYWPDASQPAFVVNYLLHLRRRIYFGSFRP